MTTADSHAPSPADGRGAPDEVEDLNRLKSRFLASLNHEIRTPLTGILGMTDLLLETSLDEEQKSYVDSARACAETLLAILNSTLEFSDLAAGTLVLEEMDFDLPGSLRAVVSTYEAKAAANGLQLVCSLNPDLPPVALGDPFRLRKLLSHLLDNALKFTHRGQVELVASFHQSAPDRVNILCKVRDTGIGIAPEKLQAIFESFEQVDSGLSRNYTGLGLGLAIARKLAQLMGGDITVESVSGRGSLFSATVTLRLPAESRATETGASATLEGGAPQTQSGRILVVEDSDIAQRIVTHVLERGGYAVRCASSGAQAIQKASTGFYDLILMDLQMPEMDGFTTARQIRCLPGYANVPILALTANATDEYRRECLRQGMQDFLAKPIRAEELLSTLARFLP